MKHCIKLALTVALLAATAADLGLNIAFIAGLPAIDSGPYNWSEQTNRDDAYTYRHLPSSLLLISGVAETEPRASTTNPHNPTPDQQRADIWVVLQGLSAPIVAFFTLVLMCVGYGQLKAIHRQADIAERSLTHLESPAIAIKIIDPGVYIGTYNPSAYERKVLVYRFVNHGRTVAHITGFDQKVRAVRLGDGSPDPFPLEAVSRQDIYGLMVAPNGGESEDIRYSCFRFVLTSHGEPYNYLRKEKG